LPAENYDAEVVVVVVVVIAAASDYEEKTEVIYGEENVTNWALKLLKEAVSSPRNVKIRILIAADNKTNRMVTTTIDKRIRQPKGFGIDVRISGQRQHQKNFLQNNNLALMIVDQSFYFSVELNDGTKEEAYEDIIGLDIYSNSEATVFAYISILKIFGWGRTHNNIHQIGIARLFV
jgi:hypothetical protein